MSKQVRQYDKEFKDQAVRLYLSRDISLPKLGQELGIPSSTLASSVSHHAKVDLPHISGHFFPIRAPFVQSPLDTGIQESNESFVDYKGVVCSKVQELGFAPGTPSRTIPVHRYREI
jgi:hypothetical protein